MSMSGLKRTLTDFTDKSSMIEIVNDGGYIKGAAMDISILLLFCLFRVGPTVYHRKERNASLSQDIPYRVKVLVTGLTVPWSLDFAPDGRGRVKPGDDKIYRLRPR